MLPFVCNKDNNNNNNNNALLQCMYWQSHTTPACYLQTLQVLIANTTGMVLLVKTSSWLSSHKKSTDFVEKNFDVSTLAEKISITKFLISISDDRFYRMTKLLDFIIHLLFVS